MIVAVAEPAGGNADADFLGAGAVKFNNFNRHWLVRGMQDGSFHFNVL